MMRKLSVLWYSFFVYANLVNFSEGRCIIIVDQTIDRCSADTNNAHLIDTSDFDLVPINDTHTYMNGTWKFPKGMESPWFGGVTLQKYVRGEWLMQAFSRNYTDVCLAIRNPLEPFYDFSKDLPGCPLEPGAVWNFDMVPIVFNEVFLNSIPPHYVGRWRAIFTGVFNIDGKQMEECGRGYGDLYED